MHAFVFFYCIVAYIPKLNYIISFVYKKERKKTNQIKCDPIFISSAFFTRDNNVLSRNNVFFLSFFLFKNNLILWEFACRTLMTSYFAHIMWCHFLSFCVACSFIPNQVTITRVNYFNSWKSTWNLMMSICLSY